MKLQFQRIHRKWKNVDNQILIYFNIRLYDKPEHGKKLLQVKLPISCKTLVDEHDGIKVTDGENNFEQNGVLELRLVRNQENNGRYDKVNISYDGAIPNQLIAKIGMMFSATEWTSFPDQDPETSAYIEFSDTFLSEFNMNDCEQVDQFLDGDRFIKYDIYINWGLWIIKAKRNDETPELSVKIPRYESVHELKRLIQIESERNEQWDAIAIANQRIIFNGSILNIPLKKLCDIPGMGNQMTVLVTLLQPNQQGLPDRAEYLAQRQPVSQKLNLMRTLQRNFKTCVKAAQKNKDPSERERHEEPETPTPQDPKVSDLGEFTQEMAETMLLYSHQLHEFGTQLVEDKNLNRNSVEYQRARRRIQNNMDAARYVSPELSNFAKFQIPLQRQSPRSLNVLPR